MIENEAVSSEKPGASLIQHPKQHVGEGRIVLESHNGVLHLSDMAFTYVKKIRD